MQGMLESLWRIEVKRSCSEAPELGSCVTVVDSCFKAGSDESHLNVSLSVRDKVTRQCPQTTTFGGRPVFPCP